MVSVAASRADEMRAWKQVERRNEVGRRAAKGRGLEVAVVAPGGGALVGPWSDGDMVGGVRVMRRDAHLALD